MTLKYSFYGTSIPNIRKLNTCLKWFSIIVVFLAICIMLLGCGNKKQTTNDKPVIDRVLLIVIDTFRADEMAVYGGDPKITPYLNSLAEEGVTFSNAWAQSPWTLPSLGTILTGLYPNEHGAYREMQNMLPLAFEVDTFPERLQREGFTTAAWFNTQFGKSKYQFNQGFDFYSQAEGLYNSNIRDSSKTTNLVVDWLNEHGDEKFLIFLHYFDPHLKYEAPLKFQEQFVADFDYSGPMTAEFGIQEELFAVQDGKLSITEADKDHLRQLYDAEMAFVDNQIGRLIQYLSAQPWASSTLIVVTSDHGEEFWEHNGFEHGHTFHDEIIHIPLIMACPGVIPGGKIIDLPVAQLDITPTILEAVGIGAPIDVSGQSLWRLWDYPDSIHSNRALVSSWPLHGTQKAAYIESKMKLIFSSQGKPVWYDLHKDAGERKPQSISFSEGESLYRRCQEFAANLESRSLLTKAGSSVRLSQEEIENLRSIGYVKE